MTKWKQNKEEYSSFRDPSGKIFFHEREIFRGINSIYQKDYELLMSSGLYDGLVKAGLLIPHAEIPIDEFGPEERQNFYKVIKPKRIAFISYPYEWCFGQLQAAALATLTIQKMAMEFGMSLKDASAYNIQFQQNRPVLIDTLSFEKYHEGRPWVAYRQYCQHFLAPLALMSHTDIRLSQLMRIFIDGVPLDLASSLLPFKTKLSFNLLSHLHLHAKSQKRYADKKVNFTTRKVSRSALIGLLDSLESATCGCNWRPAGTEWADYYEDTNYSNSAIELKKKIVGEFIDEVKPKNVWDLGANTGLFSEVVADRGIPCVAFDIDPAAVEKNYRQALASKKLSILPLVLDLTNPSPAIGWENKERKSIIERGPADAALALALIHHLAISNNLPFGKIAEFFSFVCRTLIIEFVPKDDSQVSRLLVSREDIFSDYNQETFESVFGRFFSIIKAVKVGDSKRTLYLMRKNDGL